ncbi:MAG: zinc-dependent metalloprotease [Planctomycetaceae bacterium]|nr:zinc-dependent metalloprotease [Planctomycetaceae bacterium]
MQRITRRVIVFTVLFNVFVIGQRAHAQQSSGNDDFPPHAKVLEGYEKVVSKANITPMYTLYQREKDSQLYAELPRNFATKKYYIALTLASGDAYAGLQSGEMYVYWRRYDKRLALIEPTVEIRAEGDAEAASSVKRLFTDRIVMDVPIVTIGPGGGPVIDLDALFVSNATTFFGFDGQISSSGRYGIYSITTAKAFQNNIEVAFEVPSSRGNLKTLHYSVSDIPANSSYKPRVADQRVGFFTTSYSDLAKYDDRETRVRYINRWHIEKADPKLKVSPPKNPIVFYIEHTTPVRYRRWVREGILSWNKAFENVGISDAIEVYYQDQSSGAHMDKDPEDVNYNFVRWLNNDVGTAIGPSRVNPLTGQILDADIILTDGWIRHYRKQFDEMLPKIAMEGFGPETLAWLADHPEWDPRLRLAAPSMRKEIGLQIQRDSHKPFAGHPIGSVDSKMIGDDEYDGLIGRTSQINGMCLAAEGMSMDLAVMKMAMAIGPYEDNKAAAAASPIVGDWNGKVQGLKAVQFPADELVFTLKIESAGDKSLTGSAQLADKTYELKDLRFNADSGAFSATLNPEEGVTVTLEGTLKDGQLSGSWSVNGQPKLMGQFTATKAAKPESSKDDHPKSENSDAKKDEGDQKESKASEEKKEESKKDDEPKEQMLDGMPESFVGPLIAHLVAHEVGHTLGLRHNFKGSSIYTLDQINSEEVKGKKPLAGSVMDYIGVNISPKGKSQGDYCMESVGPYDMWAIEYGYTFSNPEKVLSRVAEPELVYGTDEDTGGPDPLARRYDFSRNPLDFAQSQVVLAKHHRSRLLSDFVKDGDSWDRVRYGYELTLSMQTRAVSMMANWIGGAFVYRDKKGDPNGRHPVEVVPAKQQRDAMNFVLTESFRDDAFGLTPELTRSMGLDKWLDDRMSFSSEATWPIHDRIMGIQASSLTMLMNPTTLKRVYDNEVRVPESEDSLTLPELMGSVSKEIWSELDQKGTEKFTVRKPLISSLRRNLQREHVERLIDLTLPGGGSSAAARAISMLASENLREIVRKIDSCQAAGADRHDAYTTAHLNQARTRIEKALDADYILNPSRGGSGSGQIILLLGDEEQGEQQP